MTNLLPGATIYNTSTGDPSAQPVPGGVMNGNPDPGNDSEFGRYPPGPQIGNAAQTINTPQLSAQLSQGNVPANAQPTNVLAQPGGDSLLAQVARGQLLLNHSTYGQGSLVPQAGGVTVVPAPAVQPVAVGIPANATVASPPNYTGS
jgi:hypothetical protein